MCISVLLTHIGMLMLVQRISVINLDFLIQKNVRSLDLTTAYLHTSHQLLGGDDNFWFHFWIKHDILDLLVDIDSLVFANL